jgi:hypothetical protein
MLEMEISEDNSKMDIEMLEARLEMEAVAPFNPAAANTTPICVCHF